MAAEGLRSRAATEFGTLARAWVGPCNTVAVDLPNVTVQLPASHHGKVVTLHLKYIKLTTERDDEWEESQLPAVDGGDEYELDRVLNIAASDGVVYYLVSYKGYDPLVHQHWVTDINADRLVEKYVRSQPPKRRKELLSLLKWKRDVVTREQEMYDGWSESEEETDAV